MQQDAGSFRGNCPRDCAGKEAEAKGISKMSVIHMTVACSIAFAGSIGGAYAQMGPVTIACKDDIAKSCSGKPHDGEVRICLETNYDKVSAACKTALDSTGGGRGKGIGMGR